MSSGLTLEMWRTFIAVAEQGSSVKAATQLNKSQSAVCHSIKKMENILGHALFYVEARTSVPTELGQNLLPRARMLVNDSLRIENIATKYQGRLIDELSIAVDVLLPHHMILEVVERFSIVYPQVSLRIYETSLSGAQALLSTGEVSLAIASTLPKDMVVESLVNVELVCVCANSFSFASMEQVSQTELKAERQIVIRDSGKQNVDSGWLGSHQRLTVSTPNMALVSVIKGLGYGWLPSHLVAPYINNQTLSKIDLAKGSARTVQLQLGMNSDLAHVDELNTIFDLFIAVKSMDA